MKNSLLALLLIVAGCATGSHIVTGNARPAISPDAVKVYSIAPANSEVVGIVSAGIEASGQWATDKTVEELKKQAALIGANGLLLGGVSQAQNSQTSYGTAIGANGAVYPTFASGSSSSTSISATAIFVP
jgi:tetrahydromethanopterin S-methyltransferase subunit F